ncbi:MAG: hypothetical protein LBR91_02260, partial [Puniceicoccales bacterium]|nr:hypothetical protein [Puniceicoccales bacterium]
RPTAAQVTYILEAFAAGADDFDVILGDAINARQTPRGYFSEQTIEVYETLVDHYLKFLETLSSCSRHAR